MGARARLREFETRFYRRVRHPRAGEVVDREPAPWNVESLRGHRYCLIVSYRRDGRPVPTPMWFGLGDDQIFVRSAASDAKVARIRREPRVLVAPCTARGRPLGPPMIGSARVLDGEMEEHAERALQANYGIERRLYALVRSPLLEAAYIAIGAGDALT